MTSKPARVTTAALGTERAWWMQEALALESGVEVAPPLVTDTQVDVAIVGGGYTGLWTALALLERDSRLRIVVLEAAICGAGASGMNGGFVHGYWTSLGRVAAVVGERDALAIARAGSIAQQGIREFCRRSGTEVWWRIGGIMKVSTSPAQDGKLEQAVDVAKRLGVPEQAVRLSQREVQARCMSPIFRSGVFFPEGATVHPGRLIRGLRRAVINGGVRVCEHTPMIRLRPGRPNMITTPHGTVRADEVVLATNVALTRHRDVGSHLTNFSSYAVLTEPVPELLGQIGWTHHEAIADARMFLHYFRTTDDGRVLMGSGSGPIGFGGRLNGRLTTDDKAVARAEAGLRRLLPGLSRARIAHTWGGGIDVAADHLPFFKTLPGTRVHYGGGYSGHGVNPAWIGGQILASLACNRRDDWTALALCSRRVPVLPPEPLRFLGGSVIRTAILACEEAEDAGRVPHVLARAGATLPQMFGLRIGTR